MKIATKLKLGAVVPALMALIIGLALIFSYRTVQEAQKNDRKVQGIITGMNELSSLVSEYVLYHEERSLQQFLVQQASISKLIADTRMREREQQQILASMGRDIDLMKGSFLKLVSNHERYVLEPGNDLIREVELRLAGRLLVWCRDVVSDASHLERLVDEGTSAAQRRINWVIFILIAATTLFLTILMMRVMKSTGSSLAMLREGTEVVGAGNLGHRIDIRTRDEIGELSRSFDHMTEKLQTVTVSRDALQHEVRERKKAEAALREQREWLQVTLGSIGDAVIATDIGQRITFINPMASRLTGRSPEQARGRPIQDVLKTVNEYSREPGEDIVTRVMTQGCIVSMADHTVLIHMDGSEIPIEDSAAPIRDNAGNLLGVVIVFHDVTERRRAQEAQRRSAEELRIVADFNYNWEYWLSLENRFLYVSPSCERITGYRREDFLGDPDLFFRVIHSDDRERMLEHFRKDRFHREPFELEFRIVRRDGLERWIAHACQPVLDEQGQMLGHRASNYDITDRKNTEESLARSEEKFRTLFEQSPIGVELYDTGGRLIEANRACLDIFGLEDIAFVRGFKLFEDPSLSDEMKTRLTQGTSVRYESVFDFEKVKKEGLYPTSRSGFIYIDVIITPIGHGDHGGYLVAVQDITQRVHAERELQRFGEQLERRVRERTAELHRKNKELEDFTFIASHDLQEPLRKIRIFGDLLFSRAADNLDDRNRDYIMRMRGSAARMQTLLKSLLKYSRLTANENPFHPVDLGKSVEASLVNLEVLVQESGAHVEVQPLPVVEGDADQLIQLFQNLIGNALKFQNANTVPHVKIYAQSFAPFESKKERFYEIYVADNGIGFNGTKYLEKIFQPFQRLHGKKEFEGVGIGLAISKKIVERHGGVLTARSTPGEGSTFIIRLPEKQRHGVKNHE